MFDLTRIKKFPVAKQKKLLNVIETQGEKYNIYPLSAEQMQMWYLYMLAKDIPCYNCLMILKLKKDISDEKLKIALKSVIEKHDILHTVYFSLLGKTFQSILSEGEYDISYEAINCVESEAENEVSDFIYRPFNLFTEIPVRVLRYKNLLYIVKHHIANDGWSDGIFAKDLMDALNGKAMEKSNYQYIDYCKWQDAYFKSEEYQKHLDFWKNYLKENRGYLELPLDTPRGNIQNHNGGAKRIVIAGEIYQRLNDMKKTYHTSMYNITLAAWFITLYYFTGQSVINIGTPVLNRIKPEFQKIYGCFINTAAVCCRIDENETISDFIIRMRKNIDDVLAFQSVPVDKVINELQIERSLSFSPLYQVFYSCQSKTLVCRDEYACDWDKNDFFEIEPVGMEKTKFVQNDLDILGIDSGSEFTVDIAYNNAIFYENSIEKLINNYKCILEKMSENSQIFISELDFRSNMKNSADVNEINIADNDIPLYVRKIWEEVLGCSSFTNDQDYFDVGGNSMNCLELMDRLNTEFSCDFSIADLFTYNTITQTSEHIKKLKAGNSVQNSGQSIEEMMF